MNKYKPAKYLLINLLIVFTVSSCDRDESFSEFPDTPTNLIEFNTAFDDYNSTAPSFGETFPFCFSSNRNSLGGQFDVIYKLMTIEFDKDSRELEIFNNTNGNLSVVIENMTLISGLNQINTTSNEFGPYLIPRGLVESPSSANNRYEGYILMYSDDSEGNQNIMFTHNLDDESFASPVEVAFLNSAFDDAYPTFNMDNSQLFFSSNREGTHNIYSQETDSEKNIIDILTSTNSEVKREDVLSTAFDELCPFVIENLLVFASNRDGGFGGYDLYYSKWENGEWTAPINFGEKINSEFDEFRPIVRKELEFNNDIMIFSSNKPEGMGGFDLYYVGIKQLNE